ncbi:MAG: putative toxin-antitoxin system toxin component, PIN family [Candidatus Ancaeobacter aquaticus]|nr:putative toxin-antitoxin system toxin component, PIN family [Candidatus Ancaeobacter aquaticus]
MKVVLDSNVVISAFAGRGLCADVFEYCLYEHIIVLSEYLIGEIHKNLCRKIKVPQSRAKDVEQFLYDEAEIVNPARVPKNACRDLSDIKVLGTALAGKVEVIVTGDDDLLVLKQFQAISILTPREFWAFAQRKPGKE